MHLSDRFVRTRTALLLLTSLCLWASATVHAQSGQPFAVMRLPSAVDSGFLDHRPDPRLDDLGPRAFGKGDAIVFATVLRSSGANSLRLIFADCNLPRGSALRLTGLRDGAVQTFDARSLTDWNRASAVFNGDAVRLELVAGWNTRANRVVVTELEVGLAVGPIEVDDLCGADGRNASQDLRVGRQYPYGCTAWLANEFTVVTAGHCTRDPNQQVHFNVPPSDANGVPRFPPPQDQYPYELASVQSLDGGVGADWAVARVVANSNTGLYPGQAQGAWFELGVVPTAAAGNVRVTGFGIVTDPLRLTSSQTAQTELAPLMSVTVDTLVHGCDTTGGSSGSPILELGNDRVIGVHTHGNCAVGGNLGTRVDRADFRLTLTQTMASKVLGRVRRFGQGCPTSAGPLRIDHVGYPTIGATLQLDLGPLPPGAVGALAVGISDQSWIGGALPAPVPVAPTCQLYVSLDVSLFGGGSWSWNLPQDPVLVGTSCGVQGIVFEPIPSAGYATALSDALWLTVGRDV